MRIGKGLGYVNNLLADIDTTAFTNNIEIFASKKDLLLDRFKLSWNFSISDVVSLLPVFVCVVFVHPLSLDSGSFADQEFRVRVFDATMV